jgi:hypothetical protein
VLYSTTSFTPQFRKKLRCFTLYGPFFNAVQALPATCINAGGLCLMSKSPNLHRHIHRLLTSLSTTQPQTIHLRDGELVLYRRSRSLLYQCRYKLADGTWHRQSTGKASLEHAIAAACDLYDESRYRQKLGLAHQAHSFAHIASICLEELRHQIDLKKTKASLNDYASIIERYFVPYFGERRLEELT